MSDHLLHLLVGLPLLAAFLVFFTPRQWVGSIRLLSTLAMVAELLLSLLLLRGDYAGGDFVFTERHFWVWDLGISFDFGVDGISLGLVLLTTLICPIALQVSFTHVDTKLKEWAAAFLLLEAGLVGAFVARDLFVFYVCYELVLLPMYLFVGMWGSGNRSFTTNKFFLYTLVGSFVMFVALLYLGTTYAGLAERPSFLVSDLARLALPWDAQMWVALAFLLGFAIKMPLFPLHTWSPETYRDAPTGATIALAAVLAKLGSYGILRFVIPVVPVGLQLVGPSLAVLAVIGILYGAYAAWAQSDLKTLIAYSSLSHMGFVGLGLFALTASSLTGSVLQMVNHGITTAALFALVAMLEKRKGTHALSAFGGLAKPAPALATAIVLFAMSSIAVPGTNGFAGEFLILSGTFLQRGSALGLGYYGPFFAAAAGLGVIFGAVYMLDAVKAVVWGPTDESNATFRDLGTRDRVLLAPLVVLVFALGVYPSMLTDRIAPAVDRVLATTTSGFEIGRTVTRPTLTAPTATADAEGAGEEAAAPTAPTVAPNPPGAPAHVHAPGGAH